jgi:hypothetical protein
MPRLGTLLPLVILTTLPLSADTMTVASQGSAADPNEFNDHGGTNVSLYNTGYDGAWDSLNGAVWVSFKDTVCPNCVDGSQSPNFYNSGPADPFVVFTQFFNIPKGMVPVGGKLNILADDTLQINLNDITSSKKAGYSEYTDDFMQPGDGPFNFQTQNGNGIGGGILYADLQKAFVPGKNAFKFHVANLGAGNVGSNGNGTGGVASFGLAYVLTLDLLPESIAFTPEYIGYVPPAFLPDPPLDPTPEPASALVVVGALALLAFARKVRSGRLPVSEQR